MYLPEHYEESRPERLHALIEQHPLGVLVTNGSGGLDANHLPFELETREGSLSVLHSHVARANPVWRELAPDDEVLVVSRGTCLRLAELVSEQTRASSSGADVELHGRARARARHGA